MKRSVTFAALALAVVLPSCSRNKPRTPSVTTAPVARRDIVVSADANGTVEPINIVEVKSKASGLITRMPVETGTLVKPGDLLVQVDTRDVQNQFNQADADLKAAEANLEVSAAQKRRADEMFNARVITAQEHETAALNYANANANVVRARAALDLARQRLEDATVTAPVAGTVIEKDVSLGTVITSATGAFGGGTTLLKMADLNRVRMRAYFNETDIGQIRGAQHSVVTVDAYPDRRFDAIVEKIEPQAVIQQGVTMFPVLVTLDNRDGALKPGMNGEVSVTVLQRNNVLAIPNEAIKNMREAVATAPMLGLNADSVQAQLRAQFQGGAGFRGGQGSGAAAPSGGRTSSSPGEVSLSPQQGAGMAGGQGGFALPQVSDSACAAVTAAMQKKPAESKKLDDLRAQMQSGQVDFTTAREQMQQLYVAIGVDARTAMACRRRASGSAAPQLQVGAPETGTSGTRVRPGLVFVAKNKTFEPRMVMLGANNFDYTEVVSGLQEGDQVALLAALSLEAQRQDMQNRIRQGMGGVPGMNQQQPASGTRPAGAATGTKSR
jgi:HlyD family secretion protein